MGQCFEKETRPGRDQTGPELRTAAGHHAQQAPEHPFLRGMAPGRPAGSSLQGQRELYLLWIWVMGWGSLPDITLTESVHIIKQPGWAQRHALYSEAILHFAKSPGFKPERRPLVRTGWGWGKGGGCSCPCFITC